MLKNILDEPNPGQPKTNYKDRLQNSLRTTPVFKKLSALYALLWKE
jgi:hypothetical protein